MCITMQRPIEMERMQRIQLCTICGDRATGKHYGAVACDGCKGFFRRCVRRNHVNACRFNGVCVVDKDQRNRCQGCRLLKCFKVGMKKEAVKKERGPLGYIMQAGLSVASLLDAELCSRRDGEASEKMYDPNLRSAATVSDLCDTMRQHLLSLAKWAKLVPTFSNLPLDDQVALLHARSGDNLLLRLAQQSMYLDDVLLVTNSRVIDRYVTDNGTPNSDMMRLGMRALDELVRPFTELLVDGAEFACLKAIMTFDPDVAELSEHGRVRALRRNIQMNLENYVNSYRHDSPGRFGELLLRLPSLRSIASEMMERVDFVKAYGEAPANTLRLLLLSSATESNKRNGEALSEVRKVPGDPISAITPHSLQGDPASSSLPTHYNGCPGSPLNIPPMSELVDIKQEPSSDGEASVFVTLNDV